ncbi:MAG: hypothetical protein WCL57_12575 [Chloroflexota bacterium]|nr:hypothetical protein [Chloroflexota bacterium]
MTKLIDLTFMKTLCDYDINPKSLYKPPFTLANDPMSRQSTFSAKTPPSQNTTI